MLEISNDFVVLWNDVASRIEDSTPAVVSALATFALHATIVGAIAVWITRYTKLRARTKEMIWKVTLLVPFLSTLASVVMPSHALTWTWERDVADGGTPPATLVDVTHDPAILPTETAASFFVPGLLTWLVLALAVLATVGTVLFCIRRARLWLWLRARVAIQNVQHSERVQEIATRFGLRQRVRLSARHGLTTPVAFGTFFPEVCIPADALERLEPAERDAVLAHEIAHLASRDPFWLGLFRFVQAVMPWLPFIGHGRRSFETLAEYRCDAMAADVTSRKAVASCLVEVASWIASARPRPALAGMAPRPSVLRVRVERVLDVTEPPRFRARTALLLVGICIGTATSFAMPRVTSTELATAAPIRLCTDARALFDALVAIDIECAELARDFGELQKSLLGRDIDARSLKVLRSLAGQLNDLDARRIQLRKNILEALAREAERARHSTNSSK